mgnify:CR=1 FL=1
MKTLILDWETYYDDKVSLRRLTNEEYLRHPDFEVLGCAVQYEDEEPRWLDGAGSVIHDYFREVDWPNTRLIAHNAVFDAAIAMWFYNAKPALLCDTLAMSKFADGHFVSHKLDAVAQRYGFGCKAEGLDAVKGLHRNAISREDFATLGDYSITDVELCSAIFEKLTPQVPESELLLIDCTLRMFTEPTLVLDKQKLESHLIKLEGIRSDLVERSGVSIETLRSDNKFGDHLRHLGVEPLRKLSPKTKKLGYAFAKSDESFKELLEHPNEKVRASAPFRDVK